MIWDKGNRGNVSRPRSQGMRHPLVCSSSQQKISAHYPRFQQLLTFHCLDIVRRLQRPWQQYSDRLNLYL